MLSELQPWLSDAKESDIVHRLESPDPRQALPAEYELALMWAISKVADLQVEPRFGSRTPDLASRNILRSGPFIADIAAVSDVAFSGEAAMRRAANIIVDFCRTVNKGVGRHLYCTFLEESGYETAVTGGRHQRAYFRRRRVGTKFSLSNEMREALRDWLQSLPPAQPLRLQNKDVGVVIEWREYVHPLYRTFCSMPSVIHDVRDNPLYKILRRKSKQLHSAPSKFRRAVFLGDCGCSLLRELKYQLRGPYDVSGHDVIRTFIAESSIDLVCVFTPCRSLNLGGGVGRSRHPRWDMHIFDSRARVPEGEYNLLAALASTLPRARLLGYQAWSRHEQKSFNPQSRGQYAGSVLTADHHGDRMSIALSARALQEFLAGRLTPGQFRDATFRDTNAFEIALKEGCSIRGVALESGGVDNDDDFVVFQFARDPNSAPLSAPSMTSPADKAFVEVTQVVKGNRRRQRTDTGISEWIRGKLRSNKRRR